MFEWITTVEYNAIQPKRQDKQKCEWNKKSDGRKNRNIQNTCIKNERSQLLLAVKNGISEIHMQSICSSLQSYSMAHDFLQSIIRIKTLSNQFIQLIQMKKKKIWVFFCKKKKSGENSRPNFNLAEHLAAIGSSALWNFTRTYTHTHTHKKREEKSRTSQISMLWRHY